MPKVKKVESALKGFELLSEKIWVGKFFVCDRDFFTFWGGRVKESEKCEINVCDRGLTDYSNPPHL